jgi:hypothetical protein
MININLSNYYYWLIVVLLVPRKITRYCEISRYALQRNPNYYGFIWMSKYFGILYLNEDNIARCNRSTSPNIHKGNTILIITEIIFQPASKYCSH